MFNRFSNKSMNDAPSKLGKCLSPSASSFNICLLNLNKPLYISTKLKFILSVF